MTHLHLWIGGWGVPPEFIRETLTSALPGTEIRILPPTPACLEMALTAPPETVLGGWSLGARLLLEARASGRITGDRRITLVAPFLGFPAEAGQGGRVSATQVKFLRRWLAKDAHAALADFYQRSGLNLPAPEALPYSLAELDEGLALLSDTNPVSHSSSIFPLSSSFRILAGKNDPLIDNARLAELLPGIKILPDAGHDLADFVHEISNRA